MDIQSRTTYVSYVMFLQIILSLHAFLIYWIWVSVNEHFRILEILYIYTSFSASYPSIRQPEIDGLGRLERKKWTGSLRMIWECLSIILLERERERESFNEHQWSPFGGGCLSNQVYIGRRHTDPRCTIPLIC